MKGYKGFEKGMICRGKQYAENTVFEEENAKICESGIHFCENPMDVLDFYPILDDNCNFNEFAEVEALDKAHTDYNRKYCTKKIKIGAKLSISNFIKACVEFVIDKTSLEVDEKSSGDFLLLAAVRRIRRAKVGEVFKIPAFTRLAAGGIYTRKPGTPCKGRKSRCRCFPSDGSHPQAHFGALRNLECHQRSQEGR